MRLVMIFATGDGYEFSGQETLPVEYESAEKLLCDIEDAARKYQTEEKRQWEALTALQEEYDYDNLIRESGRIRLRKRPRPEDEEINRRLTEYFDRHQALFKKNKAQEYRTLKLSPRIELDVSAFIDSQGNFNPPEIVTVDEWYERGGEW